MTINDLKVDIISSISSLSDLSLLKQIKRTLIVDRVSKNDMNFSIWKDAEIEIREGVSFDQLVKEQNYNKISFLEFIDDTFDEDWNVSLDVLLSNSN